MEMTECSPRRWRNDQEAPGPEDGAGVEQEGKALGSRGNLNLQTSKGSDTP